MFDGQFVYFCPHRNGTDYHGEVLRYDTTAAFDDASSWATYDPGANDVGNDPDGYIGAVYDGQFVYFVPSHNGDDRHGEVLRYDTTAAFDVASSWATYDYGNHCGESCTDPDGYSDGVFDGQYVYFAPGDNGDDFHGEVLRYDTTAAFDVASSWATYDPGANDVGSDPDGYAGAVFDGSFVYFVPTRNGTDSHGEVLRYDPTGAFGAASSWATYDYGDHCGESCTDPDGFNFAVFDGRMVYFAPYHNGTDYHGEVLRYDTTGNFSGASSWATYDYGEDCGGDCADPDGFTGGVFDGRFVYFAPARNGAEHHGEVLRYDTMLGQDIPTVSEWGLVATTLLLLTAGTLVWARRRPAHS